MMSKILALILVLVGLCEVAGAAETEMLELTEHDCGQSRSLPPGGILRLTLPETGGTGFVWEPEDLEPDRLQVLQVETTPLANKELLGGPLAKSWLIKALTPGKARLSLALRRPWEQGVPPARRCVFFLEIK